MTIITLIYVIVLLWICHTCHRKQLIVDKKQIADKIIFICWRYTNY